MSERNEEDETRADEHCQEHGHSWEHLYSVYECTTCSTLSED